VTDPPSPAPEEPPRRRLTDREKAIRAFFRDDRLVSIPAKPSKRDLLLPVILDRCFPEDRNYEEKEVNMRLALLHPDVAALRRYLVDGRLMTREAGIYRRARPVDDPAIDDPPKDGPDAALVAAVRAVRRPASALRVFPADDRLDQPEIAVLAAIEDVDPL